MWVYKASRDGRTWVVGFYTPDKEWVEESVYPSREEAAARVRWLNGGN